jgi:hypothetical protein
MSGGRPFGRRTGVEAEWLPVWLLAGIRDMGSTGRSERGAGSVFYDKSSKRWVVMASLPKTGDGKRRRSRRTFKTKADASRFLSAYYLAKDNLDQNTETVSGSVTVHDTVSICYQNVVTDNITEKVNLVQGQLEINSESAGSNKKKKYASRVFTKPQRLLEQNRNK